MWVIYQTWYRERIKKFRETSNLKLLCRNELGKTCFAYDAAYSDSKDLPKRTISDKSLKDKAYEITRTPKNDGYQRALASMVYKFCDKKTGSRKSVNKKLAQELHKPVIKRIRKKKNLCEI